MRRHRLVTEGYSTWLGDSVPQSSGHSAVPTPEYRYAGINVTLYANGEAVAINRYSTQNFTGGTAYLGKDVLGSVRGISNEWGQLEERYEYDAFGKPYKGDLDSGMNLGYTGKPYDSATGMYNYGYRDYVPEDARFTTVDPIRDGANWFAYVNNDPVNWVDLWGLECPKASDKSANIPDGNKDAKGTLNGNPYEAHINYLQFNGTSKVDTVVNAYPMSVDMQTTVVTTDKDGKEITTAVSPAPIYEDDRSLGLGTSTVYNIPKDQTLVGAYTDYTITDSDGSSVSDTVVYK